MCVVIVFQNKVKFRLEFSNWGNFQNGRGWFDFLLSSYRDGYSLIQEARADWASGNQYKNHERAFELGEDSFGIHEVNMHPLPWALSTSPHRNKLVTLNCSVLALTSFQFVTYCRLNLCWDTWALDQILHQIQLHFAAICYAQFV